MSQGTEDLMSFVSAMGGDRQLRVEENLGQGFVVLRVAEAERRQAKHDIRCVEDALIELLRNARDAGARHIYVATTREGDVRTTTVLDDGVGIPPSMKERIFDARVTSKLETMHMDRWGVHGRGMALYSVRENAVDARVVASDKGLGTSLKVVTNVRDLAERADQSTWPATGTNEEGAPTVTRGPHNIVRTCCEFALEEHGTCDVYLGSPAEIVATARRRVRPRSTDQALVLTTNLDELPVLERLYAASDAGELLRQATALGLSISERTAHRIVAGEIKPQRSVYAQLAGQVESTRQATVDLMRDRRGLKLSDADASEFSRLMERDFAFLADRYYLTLTADPKVKVSQGKVTVTFEVSSDD